MSDVINVKIIGDLAYVNGVTDAAEKAATDAKKAATDAENFLAQMKVLPADLEILNQGNSLGTGVDSINFKGSGVVASKLQDGVFEVTVTASGGGSSDSAEDIRDKLESLSPGQRLDADHVDETANRKFMSDLDKAKMDKVVTHASQNPEDDHIAVWTSGELKAGPSMDGGASSLVKLDGTGKLPAIDGSQLTNLPLVDYSVKDVKFEGNNIVFEFNDGSRVVLNNAKLDLKGDKGDAGAKGDTGDKGDTGPAGADGVGGYADKGALGAGDNPQTMEAGFYYVTEKFVGAPTITSSYVGHMMIQDKIDDPNGRLLVYFTSAGIYYQQKFAGGWENWLSTATAGFRPTAPVRAFTKFAGIYQNLSELNTLVTNPQAGEQAILLDPDDAYFQYSSGSWSKLASVSDVHELYLGIFATQSELDSNHASPNEGSLAIVGDGFKYFTGGKWVDYENHDIVGLTARVNTAEQHINTLKVDVDALKGDVANIPKFDESMFQSAVDHGYAADDQGIKSSKTTDGWWVFKDLKSVGARPSDSVGDLFVFRNNIDVSNVALKHAFIMAIGKNNKLENKVWFMYRDGLNWTPWFSEQGASQDEIDRLNASIDELKKGNQQIINEVSSLQSAAGSIYAPSKDAFNKAVSALINEALKNYVPKSGGHGGDKPTITYPRFYAQFINTVPNDFTSATTSTNSEATLIRIPTTQSRIFISIENDNNEASKVKGFKFNNKLEMKLDHRDIVVQGKKYRSFYTSGAFTESSIDIKVDFGQGI